MLFLVNFSILHEVPLFWKHTNSKLLCSQVELGTDAVFFQYVDSLIYGKNILANQTSFEGYQVLWHLMPLSEGVDENKALKLISNITFNHKSNTAIILGSKKHLKIQPNILD